MIKYCHGCCKLSGVRAEAWLTLDDNEIYRCYACKCKELKNVEIL